jgi:hypothetical protein
VSDKSALEEALVWQLKVSGAPPFERGYIFAKPRKFHWDFSWPAYKFAAEINGGTFMAKGGHNTGLALRRDYAKYNLATITGWKFLLYDGKAVTDGSAVLEILRFLKMLQAADAKA